MIADGRLLAGAGGWRLPAGTKRVELHYAALSYRTPARVQFRFRLDGFDAGWIDAGSRRTAYYTNLPHGPYRFRVAASNDDGVWNYAGASLGFRLEPRFHERVWFQLLAAAVLSASSYGAHRLRVLRLEARQLELSKLVDERTEELRLANQELDRLARIDGLTRIANRRAFNEALQRAWADHRRRRASLAVVLCDVDHFKRYNDLQGHQAGDEVLTAVAQALARAAQRESDLAARYGGEEFALLLPDTDAGGAERTATAALAAVRTLAIPHGRSEAAAQVTMSFGVAAAVPDLGTDPAECIARADAALYRAKAAGRNRVEVG